MRARKRRPGPLLLGSLLLSAAAGPVGQETAAERPNLVLLLADDLSAASTGFGGNGVVHTPHMDRLAADGVHFEHAFVTTSICAASRASILTGQYARRTGVYGFSRPLSADALSGSYPVLLRASGYHVGYIGKWGIQPKKAAYALEVSSLFDYWAGIADQVVYWHERACPFVAGSGGGWHACTCASKAPGTLHASTEVFPAKVEDFLDARPPDAPFCLSVSFKAPHSPWTMVPPELGELYRDGKVPLPEDAAAALERAPPFLRSSPAFEGARETVLDGEALDRAVRDYYRTTTALDIGVGRIRAALEERGLAHDTVLILTSDNGLTLGNHGYIGKWLMNEESIRVPLVILDPRGPVELRGRTSSEMALNIDLAPTLLELAGIPVPAGMQGLSLVPVLEDAGATLREDWFYEHHYAHAPPVEGVRTRRMKYVRYIKQEPPREELYDLARDPLERDDLAGDPERAAELDELRSKWRAYRRELE